MNNQELQVFISEAESELITYRRKIEEQLSKIPTKFRDATDVQQLRKDSSFLSGQISAYRLVLQKLVEGENN